MQLFKGRMCRRQNPKPIPLGGGNWLTKRAPDVVPVHGLLHAVARTDERLYEAPITFDPVIVEPADVAHPVAVDVGIESRRYARHLRAARPLGLRLDPHGRVAAL